MGRASKLSPGQWAQVQMAVIAGAAWHLIVDQFPGLTTNALRKRAVRFSWPMGNVPKGVFGRRQTPAKPQPKRANGQSMAVLTDGQSESGQTVAEMVRSTDLTAALGCFSRLLPNLIKTIDRAELPDLRTYKDLESAVRIVKSITGMDQTQINMDLSFSVGPHGRQNPLRVYDAQTGQPVSDTPSDGNNG